MIPSQDRNPPSGGVASLDPVAAAVERMTARADGREIGVQRGADHYRRSGAPWDEKRFAAERAGATVAGIHLADLRTLLAAYAEMKEGLAVSQDLHPTSVDQTSPQPLGWAVLTPMGSLRTFWTTASFQDAEAMARHMADHDEEVVPLYSGPTLSSQTPAPVDESRAELESLRSELDLAVKALEKAKEEIGRLNAWRNMTPTETDSNTELARSALTEMRKT